MQLDLFSNIDEPQQSAPIATNTSPSKEADRQEIEALRQELNDANYRYYVLSEPTLSDFDFDQKMRRLQDLEEQHPDMFSPNSPTQHVGSDLAQKSSFSQMNHRHPMLSLPNTYSESEIRQWYLRLKRDLGLNDDSEIEIVAELKYDGLSISLWYENGILTHALTRGDGTRGDDVIDNIKTIRSIPWKINVPTTTATKNNPQLNFEIRGEVLMPWASFERLNKEREEQEEPLFANPRNAASGTLKLLDPKTVAERGLDAYLYYYIADKQPAQTHYGCLEYARNMGFNVSNAIKICNSIDEIMKFINYWDKERKKLPVATDGIVLKVNDLSLQQRLGYTAKVPRWAIAFKFKAEKQATLLKKITYQVGRTGIVTPVANLEPVLLSGSVVARATLHNEDFVRQLGIAEGDMVWVEKGGEIIPKITGVESKGINAEDQARYQFIAQCPECGTPLVRDPEQAAWRCPNEDHCPPQIKGKLIHFVERKAMNIDGIGEETIDTFYREHLLTNIADFYDLKASDILRLEGFKEKSTKGIIDGIEKSKQVPWNRVLFALGIRYVGETMAKKLARHFRSIDDLQNAQKEELITLDDVGEQIASSIVDYFSKAENIELITRLKAAGVQLASTEEVNSNSASNILGGKSIVISGVFQHHSRDEYKELIEQLGGKNSSSISRKTSFILAGDNMGPEKQRKANALGVRIMTENEFLQMINTQNPN